MKEDSSLYAWTTDESLLYRFKQQRCVSSFIFKTMSETTNLSMELLSTKDRKKLTTISLDDQNSHYDVIGTFEEEGILDMEYDRIASDFIHLQMALSKVPFNDEYSKLISSLTNVLKSNGDDISMKMDTFHLFYTLFHKTFSEKGSPFHESVQYKL